MERYFKIVEISEEKFEKKTGDVLDGCSQIVYTEDDGVYVGIDDEEEDYMDVDISEFNH